MSTMDANQQDKSFKHMLTIFTLRPSTNVLLNTVMLIDVGKKLGKKNVLA